LTGKELTARLSSGDLGIDFFFTHYVDTSSYFPKASPNIASAMWSELFLNDKMFYDAVSSVGLAGLSNVTNTPEHMVLAKNKYGKTLGRLKAAIQNPSKEAITETFKAVLLLTAFEVRHLIDTYSLY
jgi:hypothetical protein